MSDAPNPRVFRAFTVVAVIGMMGLGLILFLSPPVVTWSPGFTDAKRIMPIQAWAIPFCGVALLLMFLALCRWQLAVWGFVLSAVVYVVWAGLGLASGIVYGHGQGVVGAAQGLLLAAFSVFGALAARHQAGPLR